MHIVRNLTYIISGTIMTLQLTLFWYNLSQGEPFSQYWQILAIALYFLASILIAYSTTGRRFEKQAARISLIITIIHIVLFIIIFSALSGIEC